MRFPEISGWIFQNFKNYQKILSELGDTALRIWVPWQLRIEGVKKEQNLTYEQLCEPEELHRYRRRRKHVENHLPSNYNGFCVFMNIHSISRLDFFELGPEPGPEVVPVGFSEIQALCRHIEVPKASRIASWETLKGFACPWMSVTIHGRRIFELETRTGTSAGPG